MKLKKLRQYPVKGIIAAMATIITGNWTSIAIQGEAPFNSFGPLPSPYKGIMIVSTVALFISSFLMLYKYRISFFPVKSLSMDEVTPHRCLIVPVSTPWAFNRESDVRIAQENGRYKISVKKLKVEEWIDVPQNGITDDINRLVGTGWPWQHMLRCIEPHKDRLKHIYLIGSPDGGEKKGSYKLLCVTEFLIEHYLKDRNLKVHKHPAPVDFEDVDGLITAFNKAIAVFKKERIAEREIIIDITGGQKPVSIAGAVVTLNKNVTFQYVQTIPDESDKYKILAYDVIVQPPTI